MLRQKLSDLRREQSQVGGLEVVLDVDRRARRTITRPSRPSRWTSSANGAKSSPARMTSLNESRGRMRAAASSSRSIRFTGRRLEQCRIITSSPTPSSLAHLLARAPRRRGVEEVVDHVDRPVDAEQFLGLLLEVGGDGGDGIGTRQRVADGRPVAGIAAEQRGVGAVQRRDDLRAQLRAAASTAPGSPPWHAGPRSGRGGRPADGRG